MPFSLRYTGTTEQKCYEEGGVVLAEIDGKIAQIRATGIGELIRVVILQYYGNLGDSLERYRLYGDAELTREKILEEFPHWFSRWVIAQTFTAMTLEAFYFDYIKEKESKTQAEKKCSPPEKFKFLAEAHLGLTGKDYAECYSLLKKLNNTRNFWVHNKSAGIGRYKSDQEYFSPDECIALLVRVFKLFYESDRDCHVARFLKEILFEVQENVNSYIGSDLPHNQ